MKIYAIHSHAYNWHADTGFFHTVMFHGEALLPRDRCGVASHDIAERDRRPMRLVVNGFGLGEVFCPERSSNLVVSEPVMRRLEPLRANFKFLRVVFRKVFSLPWSLDGRYEGRMPPAVVECLDRGRECSVHKCCPHDPRTAAGLPPYYEIVTPNHYRVVKKFRPTHGFYTEPYEGEIAEDDLVPVSESMYRKYPITRPGYAIVRDDIFEVLSPFLERPFFGIKEFSFDSQKSRKLDGGM